MELAVNMPEQEPQVGQAERSTSATSASLTLSSAAMTMASTKSSFRNSIFWVVGLSSLTLPASIGPPDTNTTGMFRRMAAISMPGVILSQLEMHTMASAQCALTMYSTLSAMMSRLRQRIQHAVMAHGDTVVHGNRVELFGNTARCLDLARDQLTQSP